MLWVLEYNPYIAMVEDIQLEIWDVTSKPEYHLKNMIIYICWYILFFYIISKVLKDNTSITEVFVIGSIMYALIDLVLVGYFHRANKHIPVVLFDILFVGGVGFSLSFYLIKNYSNILLSNIPYLIIIYLATLVYFFYYSYTDTQQKLKALKEKQKATQ